jgi:hypothetical protein
MRATQIRILWMWGPETWRNIVESDPEPSWKFEQQNTLLKDDKIVEIWQH